MRSLLNKVDLKVALAPVVVTDNTAQVSAIIDRRDFESLLYVITLGTLVDADATFAVTMEEGNDSALADTSAVAAADLDGTLTLAGFNFANDLVCRKIAYCGQKRYTRLTITPTANSGNAPMAVTAVLSSPKVAPTVNPPV